MRLTYVGMQQFMQVGKMELDFTRHEGSPVTISGDNGVGKSTILGAIRWCLTGSVGRDKTLADDVVMWGSKGGAAVETRWKVTPRGGVTEKEVTVVRYRKHPKKKNNLYLLWGGERFDEGATSTYKQEDLYKILGINEVQVHSLLTFAQGELGILQMKRSDLASLIQEVMGVRTYKRMEEGAKRKEKEVQEELRKVEYMIADLQRRVEAYNSFNLAPEDEYVGATMWGRRAKASLTVASRVASLRRAHVVAPLEREERELRSDLRMAMSSAQAATQLVEDKRCPTCQRRTDTAAYTAHIQRYVEGLHQQGEEIQARLRSLQGEVERADQEAREFSKYDQRVKGVLSEVSGLLSEEKVSRRNLRELERDSLQNLQGKLIALEEERRVLEEHAEDYRFWGGWARATYIETQSLFFSTLDKRLKSSIDRFFPSQDVRVELGFEKRRDGTPNFTKLAISVEWEGRKVGYGTLSGGQLRRLNVAIQTAILSSTGVLTILFDEWFHDLDDPSLHAVWDHLTGEAKSGVSVVVVSRKSEWVDPTYVVVRANGETQLQEVQ